MNLVSYCRVAALKLRDLPPGDERRLYSEWCDEFVEIEFLSAQVPAGLVDSWLVTCSTIIRFAEDWQDVLVLIPFGPAFPIDTT